MEKNTNQNSIPPYFTKGRLYKYLNFYNNGNDKWIIFLSVAEPGLYFKKIKYKFFDIKESQFVLLSSVEVMYHVKDETR